MKFGAWSFPGVWGLMLGVFFVLSLHLSSAAPTAALSWPSLTRESRPWCYWWWMGSAVDKTNLTRQLEQFRDAGLGGVHIIPIYGAKGYEDRYISYLSPKWMEMLGHTVSEGERLGLGVDMTTGSGWCFGGPNVSEKDANASVVVKTLEVTNAAGLEGKVEWDKAQAVVAVGREGEVFSVQSSVFSGGKDQKTSNIEHRTLNFQTGEDRGRGGGRGREGNAETLSLEQLTEVGGPWKVYVVSQKFSGQKVKRPSLGGEGPMLNLIYPKAMDDFLVRFTEAFANYKGPKPRAQYHDSYEYRSDWAPDFFAQFEKRRGYRLQEEVPVLFGEGNDRGRERERGRTDGAFTPSDAESARVKSDCRETVSDLILDDIQKWVSWSHDHGFIARNEAHGSPANLLDLYAAADIPETEMFNKDRSKLVSKFASSAAHVTGRNLASAETGTWLKEHFTETLADLKYLFDDMFLSGVNHIFYHGNCYSPQEAGWPGWVFYASTEMNPRNSIWHDVSALNLYAARCQAVLQSGAPDNDVLLYWPIHDYWQSADGPLLPHLTVHARTWFEEQPIGKAAERLWNRGYSFDYVSDRQLEGITVREGKLQIPNFKIQGNLKVQGPMSRAGEGLVTSSPTRYRAIVVPACQHIPLKTMERLGQLAESGATVIFEKRIPSDVPGWGGWREGREELRALVTKLQTPNHRLFRTSNLVVGKGRVLVGDLEEALAGAAIAREMLVDNKGLSFIRRAVDGGLYYFIANRGEEAWNGWLPLATEARSVVIMDALSGRTGIGKSKDRGRGGGREGEKRERSNTEDRTPNVQKNECEALVQLQPGESIILRTFSGQEVQGPAWQYWAEPGTPYNVTGDWSVEFISGGPTLPPVVHTSKLESWMSFPGEEVQRFAGTAKYSLKFDAPADGSKDWILSLGQVAQSAHVRLNAENLGMLITPPFRVHVHSLKPRDNLLEVEVTNVSANRIRDLDRRGVKWKNFHDINVVNVNYKPFDASDWPLTDSGLLGPVTLIPQSSENSGQRAERR